MSKNNIRPTIQSTENLERSRGLWWEGKTLRFTSEADSKWEYIVPIHLFTAKTTVFEVSDPANNTFLQDMPCPYDLNDTGAVWGWLGREYANAVCKISYKDEEISTKTPLGEIFAQASVFYGESEVELKFIWPKWTRVEPTKELETDDFEREAEIFLDEVEIKEIEETCTFEDHVTAGQYTIIDGPGLAIAQQMGWNGNWQGLGYNGAGRRDPISTESSNIRRGHDRTGLGNEGHGGDTNERISVVPRSRFVQGRSEIIGDSSLPIPGPPPMTQQYMAPPVTQQYLAPPPGYPGFSICIPHVFNNIREPRIRAIFRELGYPDIEAIDFVQIQKTGPAANKVFVHFCATTYNSRDEIVDQTINMILRGETVKIIYDDPWFWNISKSRSKRPAYSRPAPRFAF